jgi:predicted RNase H-like nuclease (RuvC/YqgF family)
LEWFPRLRAISLAAEGEESEQNEIRSLQVQLETTQSLVSTLSRQLAELRDQVNMSSESIPELLIQLQIIFSFDTDDGTPKAEATNGIAQFRTCLFPPPQPISRHRLFPFPNSKLNIP